MTGQVFLDGYVTTPGMVVALGLVNDLVVAAPAEPGEVVVELLSFDPTSIAARPAAYAGGFGQLAKRLHTVMTALDEDQVDLAAGLLNDLLTAAPAVPHLAKEDGLWSLHHHPHGAGLVEAWTSICAEALARLVGDGYHDRVHRCSSTTCRRVFLDRSKNGTRLYCSERCQNREKATTHRQRRVLER